MNDIYQQRRTHLLNLLGSDSIAVIFAAPERCRSNDTDFPYRQDSYLYYLTGFEEPESALILNGRSGESILFCRPKDEQSEIWNGFRFGPDAAKEAFGMNAAYEIGEWQRVLSDSMMGMKSLYALWGRYPYHDRSVMQLWHDAQVQAARTRQTAPTQCVDLSKLLDAMRLIKDTAEIALLKRAGEISAQAHVRAMKHCRVGLYEYQLEAEFLHEFMYHGARAPSYNTIVGGGKNACCLHYVANREILRDGDLVLIDAGAEWQNYAGDITRTFPVNGRFSAAQKDLYEVVLAANCAAIEAIRPLADWQGISRQAARILTQGLVDLGILHGSVDENLETERYRRFYMHGLGHWLGLDVHDVGGRFDDNGKPILLRAGMCTTVEPGLYIDGGEDVPPAFRNIGIRIEDNVLVTEHGCENYTAAAPKTIAEIEDLMRG